jgi:acetylornithine deacetylase/succinyl-diaminopimelate desuccinylase-like protein
VPGGATQQSTEATPHLDEAWLGDLVEALASIHRPSASQGERRAAEWLRARLQVEGVDARIEVEDAHGTYWWPLGIASAAGVVAAGASLRGLRTLGAGLAAGAAAAIADEVPPRRQRLRRLLPRRRAFHVVGEVGPADADRTVVLVAHHDSAHPGLLFHPALPELAHRAGIGPTDTSPPLMAAVVGGPVLVALGSVVGSRRLCLAGGALSAAVTAALADVGRRDAVPGANDNASGVAVLVAVARALAERPARRTRVMLVSTSEEALCEGMLAFADRHFEELASDRTFFCAIDTVGSPNLLVLRGEGMMGIREYPREALELLDGLAEELGISLFPNMRLRAATDGVVPLAAGYQCAALCSCTDIKWPANYHWSTDTPENVDYGTVADAVRLTEALVRRLDERWL